MPLDINPYISIHIVRQGENMLKQIIFLCPEELQKALNLHCQKKGVTISTFIRNLLAKKLNVKIDIFVKRGRYDREASRR